MLLIAVPWYLLGLSHHRLESAAILLVVLRTAVLVGPTFSSPLRRWAKRNSSVALGIQSGLSSYVYLIGLHTFQGYIYVEVWGSSDLSGQLLFRR